MNTLDTINKARADYGLPAIKRAYRRINIYSRLAGGGEYFLDSTRWARNLKEARIMLVATRPDYGFAASDLIARYAD